MLAAIMNPDMLRNESSTHLVPTKDMGDGLSQLRAGITIGDVHARNCLIIIAGLHVRWCVGCTVAWRAGGRGVIGVVRRGRGGFSSGAH